MLVEELTKLECQEVSCGHQSAGSIALLKKHLYTHTSRSEKVQCIFCCFETSTTGTLKSHFSKTHKFQTLACLNKKVTKNNSSFELLEDAEGEQVGDDLQDQHWHSDIEQEDDEQCSSEDEVANEDLEDQEEVFIRALAITVNIFK